MRKFEIMLTRYSKLILQAFNDFDAPLHGAPQSLIGAVSHVDYFVDPEQCA